MTKKAKHFSRWKWGWGHQGLVAFGIAERKCCAIEVDFVHLCDLKNKCPLFIRQTC